MINIIGESQHSLETRFDNWGIKPWRAKQVLNWIYRQGLRNFDGMTNLSKDLRAKLAAQYEIALPEIVSRTDSKDGSIKYLFRVASGAEVEAVWMPDKSRNTLCISSQVGCRLACTFCLTGTLGLKEQITAGDILGQFMAVNEDLGEEQNITNIVMMGMGEPLDNYQPVVDALRLMVSPEALALANRRVTLSTSGLVDKIIKFQDEDIGVNLAISLNATDDKTRDEIMPINKKYPIQALLECLRNYKLKRGRRITFEYVLLDGINDTLDDAKRLVKLLHGIPSKINLIPFNPHPESPYRPPPWDRIDQFQQYLISKNYTTFVRKNRGTDILGACGQLAAQSFNPTVPG